MGPPRLVSLAVAADAEAWRAAGFAVAQDGLLRIGATTMRLAGRRAGEGVLGWSVEGVVTGREPIDGLPTEPPPEAADAPGEHPNGATHVDHVVVVTPALARTLAALADAGLDLRRTRDVPRRSLRQAFYRLGEVVLEVVGPPDSAGAAPAEFWGLVVVLPDLAALPEGVAGDPHDAVQPGRRICTACAEAQLGANVAFMTP